MKFYSFDETTYPATADSMAIMGLNHWNDNYLQFINPFIFTNLI